MLSYYCLKFTKNTETKNPKVAITDNKKNNDFIILCRM